MKHRFVNKKTGVESRVIAMYLNSDGVMQVDGYDAVEDLMDDYAAYEKCEPSKEPLIKDEKIRKAVRAWAEASGLEHFTVVNEHFNCCKIMGRKYNRVSKIEFLATIPNATHRTYTITELCGEEEE